MLVVGFFMLGWAYRKANAVINDYVTACDKQLQLADRAQDAAELEYRKP